jgi:hypothetical protein
MKMFNQKIILIALTIFIVFGFVGTSSAFAMQAVSTPTIGQAATFGILSSTFTPTIATTVITGDLGYTTLSTALFFSVSGSTYTDVSGIPAGAIYQQAGSDQNGALALLNNQGPCTDISAGASALDGVIIGANPPGTFPPGCYTSSGAMNITATTNITLLGAGTYVFRPGGALTTGANSHVLLSGPSECDIFWTPTGATNLGDNSTFIGTVIDAAGINIGDTVGWIGRALAFGGTVGTNHDTIVVPPSCSTAQATPQAVTPTGTGRRVLISQPSISVTKTPTPSGLFYGPGSVVYDYSVKNTGTVILSNIKIVDDKCPAVNFISGDTNNDSKLDLNETWKYSCVTILVKTTTNLVTVTGEGNNLIVSDTASASVIVYILPVAPLVYVIPATTSTVASISTSSLVQNSTTVIAPIVIGSALAITASTSYPGLPNTGIEPYKENASWGIYILDGVLVLMMVSVVIILRRRQFGL